MNTFGLKTRFSAHLRWKSIISLPPKKFVCGHCNHTVSSSLGNLVENSGRMVCAIYICPECNAPTYFDMESKQFPKTSSSSHIKNLPKELEALLNEAKISSSLGANTASVLCCRKMLMNIAVQEGADEGKRFIEYVEFLSDQGFVPPNGKGWVDYIRTKGNEANHEIALMNDDDSSKLLAFVEMLMKFIYEFPSMIPNNNSK